MRRYQPIWERIKKSGVCKVSVPAPLQERVIKAVKKEKDIDAAYQFLLSEDCKRARLQITRTQSLVEFKLIVSIGLSDL